MANINLKVTLKDIEDDAKHPGLTAGLIASLLEQFLRESLAYYPRSEVQRTLQNETYPGINVPVINVSVIKRRVNPEQRPGA